MDEKQIRASELEATINQLKRDNMNLLNEISHMQPDLDKKTEVLEIYEKRLKKFKEDFEGYKLRNLREKSTTMKYASEKLLLNLLEVLDNMERALKNTKADDNVNVVIDAVKQMKKQMLKILEKEGVKIIEAKQKGFNPKYHEAIVQVDDDSLPDGTVIEEILTGYIYKDKILRPTRVKVSKSDKMPPAKAQEIESLKKVEEEKKKTLEKKKKADKKEKPEKKEKADKKKGKAKKEEKKIKKAKKTTPKQPKKAKAKKK
jgi:molecular chaperone GrpE